MPLITKLFDRDAKNGALESLIYVKLIIVFSPNLEFSFYSEVL